MIGSFLLLRSAEDRAEQLIIVIRAYEGVKDFL